MQNEYFYNILWYFNKRKSKNRGLKQITLLFHEAELSHINWNALQALF